MTDARAFAAAVNNAAWCDAVCRSHGTPGTFDCGLWLNRAPVPRFYPNAITLSPELDATGTALIESFAPGTLGAWAVKDSFATCDLAPHGYALLFEAEWLFRPASAPLPQARLDGVSWSSVRTPDELAEWERAWAGVDAHLSRIFTEALLREPGVSFVAARRGGGIVAGAAVNLSGAVAGLSNFFAPEGERLDFRAACLSQAADIAGDRPLVGYESGDDLALCLSLGFAAVGPLRVWVHSA